MRGAVLLLREPLLSFLHLPAQPYHDVVLVNLATDGNATELSVLDSWFHVLAPLVIGGTLDV